MGTALAPDFAAIVTAFVLRRVVLFRADSAPWGLLAYLGLVSKALTACALGPWLYLLVPCDFGNEVPADEDPILFHFFCFFPLREGKH
jgi:hypothetical protein